MAGGCHVTQKVCEQGGSPLLALPRTWVEANEISQGSTVEVGFDGSARAQQSQKREMPQAGRE